MTEVGRVTAAIDGDISGLTSALNQARGQATTAVSGIEGQFKGGLSSALSGGDIGSAGKNLGKNLVDNIAGSFGPIGSAVGEVATALGPTGLMVTAGVAGAALIGSAASSAAMEWESGMSQISKTTGIAKGTEDFAALDSQLKDLYSTMPTTVAGIQGVASAAGSLGIEKSSIAGFTEVALEMGSAFDMPAEEAAVAMGKIKSQLKSLPEGVSDSTEFARQMGSAIDSVGNNYNATEKDVLDFATRTSGSLSALGGNAYEIAGWGGMLASVFPSAERAAGSFDSLLTQLTTNTDSQSAAAELLGVSTNEFMQSMSTDPSDTLLRIGSAMEALPADQLLSTAKALGGSYGMDTLTKMVGHTEEWGQAIDDTVAAGQKGESIGQSFAAGADNAKSAFAVLKNSINAILTDIGGPINAALAPLATSLAGTFNGVREIGENLWEPFTTAISPATAAVSLLASGVGTLGGMTLSGLVDASKAINTAFQVGKAFVTAFGEEISDIITSSSAFQTVAGYVEDLSNTFSGLYDSAVEVFDKIVDGLSNAIPTAISGAAGAVGSLFDQAGLGGITDAASSVSGFLGDVYDNAAEKLGWGVEKGTQEGMENGTENAKGGVEQATKEGVAAGAEAGLTEAETAYWSNVEQLQAQGIQTGYASTAYAGMTVENKDNNWANNVWTKQATISELPVEVHHDVTGQGSKYTLRVNGQEVASRTTDNYDLTPRGDLVMSMIEEAGLETDMGTALDLANKPLQAAQWRLSQEETVTVDTYLNFAANLKSEMSGAGQEIGDAFAAGIEPDAAAIESRLESIRRLKLYDPEEAKAQGADNAIVYLDAIKSAIESYDEAKAKYLLEPDNERAAADLATARANLQTQLDGNPLTVKVETGWGQFDTKSLPELIYDEDALKAAAVDTEKFFDGTIVPGIRSGMESAKNAISTGQITQGQVYDALIKPLEAVNEYLPAWLEEMNALFKAGTIDAEDYIWLLDSMTGKATEAVDETSKALKNQTVGWDALKDSIEECSDCAVSDFAVWQESQDDLFSGSYIGGGGEEYLAWKQDQVAAIAETQAAMKSVGGAVVGQDYTDSSILTMKVGADTSDADSSLQKLVDTVKASDPLMTVQMDTGGAMAEVNRLATYIIQMNPVMSVQVSISAYADEIRAIVEDEIRSALA